MSAICAAEGCTNPVPRRQRRGRPPIYCSPECRPSRRRPGIVIEVAHADVGVDGRSAGRLWTVRLRRGPRAVVLADGIGWASATALSENLHALLEPSQRRRRVPLE